MKLVCLDKICKVNIAVAWVFIFALCIYGQQETKKTKYVEIPSPFGLVLIMNQPDSPLKFEEVQLLTDEQGKIPHIRYLIKNNSSKQVVSFAIEFHHKSKVSQWLRYGDSWVESVGKKENNTVIIPVNGIYENINKRRIELVPMTKEVSDIFKIVKENEATKTLWVGFIKKVIFEDGSEFNTDNLGNNLDDFLLNECN